MGIRWLTAFLDTPAASAGVAEGFWLAVTATTCSERRGPAAEFATLRPAGGDAFLRVQVVGDGLPRAHLDVHVDDVAAEVARARLLGARHVADGDDHVVLRSVGGVPFCVVPHGGRPDQEAVRPAPVHGPGGRSLVDQICLDVAPAAFGPESAFWSAFSTWERGRSRLPEFSPIVPPAGMPLRLLIQRLDDEHAAGRAHLNFACDDVEAEVGRHEILGASAVRRARFWATMRDPAGREYCLTSRDPDTGLLAP